GWMTTPVALVYLGVLYLWYKKTTAQSKEEQSLDDLSKEADETDDSLGYKKRLTDLRRLIVNEKRSVISSEKNEIRALIEELSVTKEEGYQLLDAYQHLFKSD